MGRRHLGSDLHRGGVKKMTRMPLLDPNMPAAYLQNNSVPDLACLGFGTTVTTL